jgi:hypothetical protein
VPIEVNKLVTNKLDYHIMENINEKQETKALSQDAVIGSALTWYTADNQYGTDTLKQHAFVYFERYNHILNEFFPSNKSLCGNIVIRDGDMKAISVYKIEKEILNETKVCRRCLLIARKKHFR